MPNPFIDDAEKNKTKYVYHPRLTAPNKGNPYYNKPPLGYNTAIIGNKPKGSDKSVRTGEDKLNVLPNCVGYAYGRFNEIVGKGRMAYLSPVNAEDFMKYKGSCQSGRSPRLGSCMVWSDTQGPGHVAIVEQINSNGSIVTSESEWNGSAFKKYTRKRGVDGNWIEGCGWIEGRRPRYSFLGFI